MGRDMLLECIGHYRAYTGEISRPWPGGTAPVMKITGPEESRL